jgi:hypothetical protein
MKAFEAFLFRAGRMVMIAHYQTVGDLVDQLQRSLRVRAVPNGITEKEDSIGRAVLQIFEHGGQGLEVCVYVRQDGNLHL